MSKMTWRYGIVLHKPEHTEHVFMFASIGEIFEIDGKPAYWVEASLTYFESVDELKENLRTIENDILQAEPIIYPDDFCPELMEKESEE